MMKLQRTVGENSSLGVTGTAPVTSRGPVIRLVRLAIWVWVVFNVALLAWVLMSSFKDSTEIFSQEGAFDLPSALHWENYAHAWSSSSVGRAFINTVLVVGISSVVIIAVCAPAAYALARFRTRSAGPLVSLFAIGMGIPLQTIVIPIFVVYQSMGLLNSLLGLGLLYVATQVPFTVFLLTGFFRSLPTELEEAASIDGASVLRTFRDIMLPLAKPGLITALTLNVVLLWNETALVLYLMQDDTKFTLGRSLLNLATVATYTSDWGAMFAGSAIVVVPILIAYLIVGRRIVEGLTLGAGK
jgi:N-acetylglucosamine transport system permease protein